MKQLKLKLKQKKGETLVEALVSLLIIVLAMGLLSSSVMASAKINDSNRKMDEEFNEDLMRAETFQVDVEHPVQNIDLIITFSDADPHERDEEGAWRVHRAPWPDPVRLV